MNTAIETQKSEDETVRHQMSKMQEAIKSLLCVVDLRKRGALEAMQEGRAAIGNPLPNRIDAASKDTGARIAVVVYDQTAGRRRVQVIASLGNKLIMDHAPNEGGKIAGALAEAEDRARSILTDGGNLLRDGLTARDIYGVLDDQLRRAISTS